MRGPRRNRGVGVGGESNCGIIISILTHHLFFLGWCAPVDLIKSHLVVLSRSTAIHEGGADIRGGESRGRMQVVRVAKARVELMCGGNGAGGGTT